MILGSGGIHTCIADFRFMGKTVSRRGQRRVSEYSVPLICSQKLTLHISRSSEFEWENNNELCSVFLSCDKSDVGAVR